MGATGDNIFIKNVSADSDFGSGDIDTTGTITGTTIAGANTNWDAAYTHIGQSGASHTYIDQAVTIAGNPTFATLTTTGGRVITTTRRDTTYTALVTDDAIYCDTDGAAWTLTLPAGVDGQKFMITNCGSSGNDLTVDAVSYTHLTLTTTPYV